MSEIARAAVVPFCRGPPWPAVDSAWKLVCHRGNEYELREQGCTVAGERAVRGGNEAVMPHGLERGLRRNDG